MSISEFLAARLDEDEAEVRAGDDFATLTTDGWMGHAATWGRERALAEIAAKRAIVALHSEQAGACYWSHDSMAMHEPGEVCDTLRALVQPYAEHPDFDPSWRI